MMFRQKYGRPNEATPAKWQKEYTDFNAPLEVNGVPSVPQVTAGVSKKDVEMKDSDAAVASAVKEPAPEDETKKRKGREDETPEERAERKRRKKEKKEKRKSKGDKGGEESD